MPRKRNKTVIPAIRLEKYAAEGKSIATMEDGKTLFVTGGIPGDVAEVLVLKNKKSFAEGKMLKIVTKSPQRIEPFCGHFGTCGGCKWQMLPYEQQLVFKQQQVKDQLSRIGQVTLPEFEPILGSVRQQFYRNKLEFTFSELSYLTDEEIAASEGTEITRKPALGFHAPGMFDKVVDIDTCFLQEDPTNKIKNLLRQWALESGLGFYNSRTKEGWWRNVIIRISTLGELMVNLIVKDEQPVLFETLGKLKEAVPGITSLHYTLNSKLNDTIYDLPVQTYYGKGFIEEQLGEFRYKISPKSFFQTNSYQAEKLYDIVRRFAGLSGREVVYDLYCGTGSIGIFLSGQAQKVVGIETVADAIKDAKVNAEWNHLNNCSFHVGDVSQVATDDFFEEHGRPDVIITDPPRPGMSEKLIGQLLKMRAPKLVYVSCNPATQARDLQWLDAAYQVDKIQPVDMFPHTHHIENVALLTLKQK
ncbi:MAG TPA: 23S rRNA (uracil(1939)-C(5))-methyltransferase RlmD [Edaphocola sp.]|nr:23S rRNA (uracil(1939)-C(5))-methyltransferase RlmD [Edaphocola sp.]